MLYEKELIYKQVTSSKSYLLFSFSGLSILTLTSKFNTPVIESTTNTQKEKVHSYLALILK